MKCYVETAHAHSRQSLRWTPAHNMFVIDVYFSGSRIRGDGYDVCTYRKTFRNTSTVTGSLDIVIRPTERNRLLCTTFIQSSKISCGKGTVFNPLETPSTLKKFVDAAFHVTEIHETSRPKLKKISTQVFLYVLTVAVLANCTETIQIVKKYGENPSFIDQINGVSTHWNCLLNMDSNII